MATMSDEEAYDFLGAGTRTGHIATVRADGRPHVKPVWFILDGTPEAFVVLLNTGAASVAGRNLARDNRVSISVDDPNPPFSFVALQGTAELIEESVELKQWATQIASRYMGPERAEEYGARNSAPGELLVRITPTSVVSQSNLAH
jgi:PPOX class probable F420-dependent enzyme